MFTFSAFFLYFRSLLVSRLALATEILVLRQQLVVLNRTVKRPKLRRRDRLFGVSLSRLWKDWREALIIVKPETVIKWHREGFRLYWRWKSKAPVGRPKIDQEIRELIRRMSRENPLWGSPRIQAELSLLGFNVTERTVAKYRNSYIERVIGSIRRECLDHLIVINEDHLRRILRKYLDYYHNCRPHQSLERNSPTPRKIETPSNGKIFAIPQVGGLHHLYSRAA
jgi:hypothetical protein